MVSELHLNSTNSFLPDNKGAMLSHALEPVRQELTEVRRALPELLPTRTKAAKLICDHVFKSEGKMIRPAMFLLCSKMLSYSGKDLIPIAAVCEYVHTASLLHDDVVDNSPLRRNKPTANKLWGDEAAVLAGDLIYSTASEIMADTGKIELVKTFARAIRKMSDGELLHLDQLFSFDISEEEYFKVLSGKTAVLMGAACKSAGILADASPEQLVALERFGHDLGMAFQLTDDALDYLGSETLTGKEMQADFAEGKVTLPVILLRDLATEAEKDQIREALASATISQSHIDSVVKLTKKYQTAQKTLEIARSFTEKGTHKHDAKTNASAK